MSQVDTQELLAQFRDAREQANQANRQRYNQLLETVNNLQARTGETYDQVLENISSLGGAQRERIQRQMTQEQATAEQDLISRGLGNTTIRSSVRRGISSDAERAQANLTELLAQQRAQALQNRSQADIRTTQMETAAIEGRQDVAPNTSMYAQMIERLASQPDDTRQNIKVGRGLPAGSGTGGAGAAAGGNVGSAGGASLSGTLDPYSIPGMKKASDSGGSAAGVRTESGSGGSSGPTSSVARAVVGQEQRNRERKRRLQQQQNKQKQQAAQKDQGDKTHGGRWASMVWG